MVPSDDYSEEVDGVVYHPHEGEWVQITRSQSVAEFKAMKRFSEAQVAMRDAELDPDEQQKAVDLLEPAMDDVIGLLAERVYDWSWTNDADEPLPRPFGKPEILRKLSALELNYLLMAARGEAPAERKNGSADLPTTSLAIASPETAAPKATTARSRTKRS